MKYMLMMHAPRGSGDWNISDWSAEDFRAHMAFMHRLNKELRSEGVLVGVEGLAPPGQARIVRSDTDENPVVTDGPFPETKEFLAGYWIVDVESPKQAHAIAARASRAPGPRGVPLNMPIEVREVMSGLPVD
jgi:hypothetical protein